MAPKALVTKALRAVMACDQATLAFIVYCGCGNFESNNICYFHHKDARDSFDAASIKAISDVKGAIMAVLNAVLRNDDSADTIAQIKVDTATEKAAFLAELTRDQCESVHFKHVYAEEIKTAAKAIVDAIKKIQVLVAE
jgi:hypothetical protein